jgi:pimeloyl-ACP methyl ester carboxylesterase
LLALTDALDLGRLHLAGNSMGGAIAALLAAAFPERVESLAFVGGPLGIVDWGPGVRECILNGDNPFIPMDDEELDQELALLFAAPPTLPADERAALLDDYHRRLGHYRQVWDVVNLFDTLLSDADGSPLPVDMPVLILWGEDDGIYPVAGAQALAARQPQAQVRILPDTSHLPMLERPAATVSALLEHLATASRGAAGRTGLAVDAKDEFEALR